MSHLSNAITRIMRERERELNAAEVARICGIDRSFFSRVIRGHVGVSPDMLKKITMAVGRNKSERAEIISAHMKDQYGPHYEEFIQLITNGRYDPKTIDLHTDIEYLQKHLNNPGIQKSVRGIVELHRAK